MKSINTVDAVGHVLCHDITRIVKDEVKEVVFKKGHVVKEEDIPILLNVGKEHLFVWEKKEGMLHEDEAAEILRDMVRNDYMRATQPSEGKIELIAEKDGLLLIDVERLKKINTLGEMIISTIPSGMSVKVGDKLCGTRVIPLTIEKDKMKAAKEMAGDEPILKLLPFSAKKYGVITTGSEVFHGRIKDSFTPVLIEKMTEYNAELIDHKIMDDNPNEITEAINEMIEGGADIVLCSGGMSVDPDDKTPLAIKNTKADIVSYGAPVLPGAMFLLAYTKENKAICGLPGCVMYSKRTIFDLVLPLLMADIEVTREWIGSLGNGGLCLNCDDCRFPNCVFWKGI